MTREQIDLLDSIRVWHKEQANKLLDKRRRARSNKELVTHQMEHHRLAWQLLETAVKELSK